MFSLERFETSVARLPFIEPDEDAASFRQGAEIDLAIVIQVGGDDGNDAVVKLEDLRRAVGQPHDDVRIGRPGKNDAVGQAVTIEIGFDRCIGRPRQEAHRGRRGQSTTNNSSDCLDACSQLVQAQSYFSGRDLTSDRL